MAEPTVDLASLDRMRVNAEEGPLKWMLENILPMKDRVSNWTPVPASGFAVCFYNPDGTPKEYQVNFQTGNLGNIIHELTHVAVNEAYNLSFINHPVAPVPADVPAPEYDPRGRCTNEEDRQAKLGRVVPINEIHDKLKHLEQWTNVAGELKEPQKKDIRDKLAYARMWPAREFDCVVNQILIWLHEWGVPVVKRSATVSRTDNLKPFATALLQETEKIVNARTWLRQG